MSSGDPTKEGEEGPGSYRALTSQERAERIWRWYTSAYRELSAGTGGDQTLCYLGRTLVAPSQVMPIVPMSHLLGEAVLSEVTEADRVLDMGTGSGVNAVLAASDRWRSWPWTSIPTRWRLFEITPCAMVSPTASRCDTGPGPISSLPHSPGSLRCLPNRLASHPDPTSSRSYRQNCRDLIHRSRSILGKGTSSGRCWRGGSAASPSCSA
jgi:hypothetical protein